MFWWSLYIYVLIWGLFSILALIQLSNWMVLSVIAMVFNLANVIGYTKCEKVGFARFDHLISITCLILF